MTEAISIKFIRACFESEHYPEYFKGHHTHEANVKFIDQIIAFTQDRALIKRIVASGLPEGYKGDAEDEVDIIIDSALKKGFDKRDTTRGAGEGNRAKKKTPAEILFDLIVAADVNFFHDAFKRAYMSVGEEDKGRKNYPLTSTSAQLWFQKLYYNATKTAIHGQALKDVITAISAIAVFDGPERQICSRVARHKNSVIINLGDDVGKVVIIDANGYRVTTESPVVFIRSMGMLALPEPETGGNLRDVQRLLNLNDINFCRILAFLINCLKPDGPYLFLLVEGEQGSGKSLLCQLLKMLIDPHQAPKLRLPDSERDLMIQAKENYLLLFDNLSGMKGDMSDALCSLSTGGGFSTRKLYTDDELQIFNECRPYILNGITSVANRPDLMERSISIKLPAMPEAQRQTEEAILQAYQELKPRILGALFDAVSCALRRSHEVKAPTSVRMADAAKWLAAAEPATGLAEGALLNALETSQHELAEERMSNNSLAVALAKFLRHNPYKGTVGGLFEQLD